MTTTAAQHRAWYYANLDAVRRRYNGYYHKGRDYITSTKVGKPCTDCGIAAHVEAMQYDHIGTDKTLSVSRMATYSRARVDAEITKCELVCANCHAVRTFKRRQSRLSRLSLKQVCAGSSPAS